MGNETDELFYELYNNYFRDVYRFVYQMVREKEQVEDLLQEIFLLVYKNLKRFRGESEYKTWLFAIAHNHVKSFWRKWLRRKKIDTVQQEDLYRQPPAISSEEKWEKRYLSNGSELEIYHGNQTIQRSQLATGKSNVLLPNVHGDQELLIDDRDLYSGYLISNWEAAANTSKNADPQQQMGTLTLWHVTPSGEAKKITTMQTTYAEHKVQIVQNNNGPIITANEIQLYIGRNGQDYFLNLKTDAFRSHPK